MFQKPGGLGTKIGTISMISPQSATVKARTEEAFSDRKT